MIITNQVIVTINYLNINHYKSIGFEGVKHNQKIIVSVNDLPLESNTKIRVKCDICGVEKTLSYQKYNKNIRKYNLYTCDTSCAQLKNKLTLKNLYGSENFNRSDENKIKLKEKYDLITKEIEDRGYIVCRRCDESFELSNYIKNINGRYKSICRQCRNKQIHSNRLKNPNKKYKENYKKNIHIYAWRNLLKNYLYRKGLSKSDRTFNLLKYSPEDLRQHLESLFSIEMNWSNYGKYWQIDHIIPVSLFKPESPIDIVNSLENLRPLEKTTNNLKKNKIDEHGLLILEKYKPYLNLNYK